MCSVPTSRANRVTRPRTIRATTLLLGAIVGLGLARGVAAATDPDPAQGTKADDRQPDTDPPTPWGAIVAGCLGVGFGGLLAAWQIKALSKRR